MVNNCYIFSLSCLVGKIEKLRCTFWFSFWIILGSNWRGSVSPLSAFYIVLVFRKACLYGSVVIRVCLRISVYLRLSRILAVPSIFGQ